MFQGLRRSIFCRPFHGLHRGLCHLNPAVNCWAISDRPLRGLLAVCFESAVLLFTFVLFTAPINAQVGDYEGRPVSAVEVVLEGTPADASAQAEFKTILKVVAGSEYSAVNVRQSLHDLFASGRVASARVEIKEAQPGGGRLTPIRVQFIVQRQVVIAGVTLRLGLTTGTPIARDEIRARLNLLEPGRRFSIIAIERNADEIQAYLRDRGYYNATVEHSEIPDPSDVSGTRRIVVYTSRPGHKPMSAPLTSRSPDSIPTWFGLCSSFNRARRSRATCWATISIASSNL